MSKKSEQERQEAAGRLREWVKPGDTVYCILRHVSASGMNRTIQLVKIDGGEPAFLGWNAAKALGYRYDEKREGVKIGGCGMDMGFALVSELGRVLFPDGGQVEHSTRSGQLQRGGETQEPRGEYLLRHRWL